MKHLASLFNFKNIQTVVMYIASLIIYIYPNNWRLTFSETQKRLEKKIEELNSEKDIYFKQMKEFEAELDEVKIQLGQLRANHEQIVTEHAEAVRNLKVYLTFY